MPANVSAVSHSAVSSTKECAVSYVDLLAVIVDSLVVVVDLLVVVVDFLAAIVDFLAKSSEAAASRLSCLLLCDVS